MQKNFLFDRVDQKMKKRIFIILLEQNSKKMAVQQNFSHGTKIKILLSTLAPRAVKNWFLMFFFQSLHKRKS